MEKSVFAGIKPVQVYPIGRVRATGRNGAVWIAEPFRSALKQLDKFSHLIVIWWADRSDRPGRRAILTTNPPYARNRETGVFACRSPYRPNPVALTTCRIVGVDPEKGLVRVRNLDARAGTPVIDLKAYFPVCDRVKKAQIPEWCPRSWPEWVTE